MFFIARTMFFSFFLFLLGCDSTTPPPISPEKTLKKETADSHGHHQKGPHGGVVVDAEGIFHVELLQDKKAGTLSLYILGADEKTPQLLSQAPLINLKTASGPKQIKSAPVNPGDKESSAFEATDEALKTSLQGRLAIHFQDKPYQIDISEHSDHPHHGEEEHGHAHAEQSISHTAWTEKCEWFIELETPEEGKSVEFVAHITLLEKFSPAQEGKFLVKATSGSQTVSTSADKPSRSGIFTPTISFASAGKWQLQCSYQSSTLSDSIEYEIEVYASGKIPHPEEENASAISFLKEQQWKVPFSTQWTTIGNIPSSANAIAVPISAVIEDAGNFWVYVQVEGESFEKREVQKGIQEGNWVEIKKGLAQKERIVVQGQKHIVKK